ncbi:MAG: 4-hydroxy-tetrahydrodipicolinate reductase [Gemmatimonadota bacterium]
MKLALIGYGRMGRTVDVVARERGHEVALVLDEADNAGGRGITSEATADVDLAIDFSTAEAVLPNTTRLAEVGVNVVVGTTGWDSDRARVEEVVRTAGTGLLHAPNFSVGMLLFTRMVTAAARMVNGIEDYDIHLSETHHRHKVDHPGGTARRLAELLVTEVSRKNGWTTDLTEGEAPDPTRLQVSVARVGEVPGIHSVGFEGPDDRIELRHEARNRNGFARGAVLAAEWMPGRAGIFTMEDLIDDLLGRTDARSR